MQGIHVPERINNTSTPPQHALNPTASSRSLGNWRTNTFNRGGLEISHWNVSISLLFIVSQNNSGTCQSTSSLLHTARMATLTHSSLATLLFTKFIRSTTSSTYNSASYIPHSWMSTTPTTKLIE